MQLNALHHIAIICSDYERSKIFYTDVLGFKIESEYNRKIHLYTFSNSLVPKFGNFCRKRKAFNLCLNGI